MNRVGSMPEACPSCVRANTPSGSHSLLSGFVCGALAAIASACWAYCVGRRDRLVVVVDLVAFVVHVLAVAVGGRFARTVTNPAAQCAPRCPAIGRRDTPCRPAGIVAPEVQPRVVFGDLVADLVAPLLTVALQLLSVLDAGGTIAGQVLGRAPAAAPTPAAAAPTPGRAAAAAAAPGPAGRCAGPAPPPALQELGCGAAGA